MPVLRVLPVPISVYLRHQRQTLGSVFPVACGLLPAEGPGVPWVAYNLRLDAHQDRSITVVGCLSRLAGGKGPGQKLDAQTRPGGLLPDAAGGINSIV
jgi:hypothetical protein